MARGARSLVEGNRGGTIVGRGFPSFQRACLRARPDADPARTAAPRGGAGGGGGGGRLPVVPAGVCTRPDGRGRGENVRALRRGWRPGPRATKFSPALP